MQDKKRRTEQNESEQKKGDIKWEAQMFHVDE